MTTGWRLTMTGVVVVGRASSLTACAKATRNRGEPAQPAALPSGPTLSVLTPRWQEGLVESVGGGNMRIRPMAPTRCGLGAVALVLVLA
jgi:hypothetical protein